MSLNKIHLFISSEIALPPAGKDVLINTGYKYAIGLYNESDGCFWFDGDCWCKGNVEWADIEHIIDVINDLNENIENGKIDFVKSGVWIRHERKSPYDNLGSYRCSTCGNYEDFSKIPFYCQSCGSKNIYRGDSDAES